MLLDDPDDLHVHAVIVATPTGFDLPETVQDNDLVLFIVTSSYQAGRVRPSEPGYTASPWNPYKWNNWFNMTLSWGGGWQTAPSFGPKGWYKRATTADQGAHVTLVPDQSYPYNAGDQYTPTDCQAVCVILRGGPPDSGSWWWGQLWHYQSTEYNNPPDADVNDLMGARIVNSGAVQAPLRWFPLIILHATSMPGWSGAFYYGAPAEQHVPVWSGGFTGMRTLYDEDGTQRSRMSIIVGDFVESAPDYLSHPSFEAPSLNPAANFYPPTKEIESHFDYTPVVDEQFNYPDGTSAVSFGGQLRQSVNATVPVVVVNGKLAKENGAGSIGWLAYPTGPSVDMTMTVDAGSGYNDNNTDIAKITISCPSYDSFNSWSGYTLGWFMFGRWTLSRNGDLIATDMPGPSWFTGSGQVLRLTHDGLGTVKAYINGTLVYTYNDSTPLVGSYAGTHWTNTGSWLVDRIQLSSSGSGPAKRAAWTYSLLMMGAPYQPNIKALPGTSEKVVFE